MNRRHLAVLAVVIAVPLFTIGLISPVPDYGPQLETSVYHQPDGNLNEETPTVAYRNLSTDAQQLFDKANNNGPNSAAVPIDDAPTSWATLVSETAETNERYVRKNGKIYGVYLTWDVPAPSFGTVMLRLGPLLGAIGLGTLAGFLILEDSS
ncbi:hypothetical protein [Halocatena pleomorpha]|uniref:DUF7979 domain-containing protein n=1 Tax=Halocatena pleomorpha TaxID=1785090 RepID=A0A3P3RMA6_9EURY|nr:hypothetical protein [Halocatena pleomorpha]RRJ34000.1 hypothetical protein EIK79_00295 [Halocatena pleomorpha]